MAFRVARLAWWAARRLVWRPLQALALVWIPLVIAVLAVAKGCNENWCLYACLAAVLGGIIFVFLSIGDLRRAMEEH